MALTLSEKQVVVSEVAEIAATALSAVASEYRGLTVEQMTELRAKARESGVYLRVIKNTLVKRAIEGTDFECMQDRLKGPLVMAFSQEDPGAAARLVRDFSKENDQLVIKVLSVGGEVLEASDIGKLANLPTRDQAIAMLMSVMKAPVEKLARTLNEVPSKLVRTLAAVKDSKSE